MSIVQVGLGSAGPGCSYEGPEGKIYGGVHTKKTYPTPGNGKISVEGKTILSYSGGNGWNAVGTNITINNTYKYSGKNGRLYLNGELHD